MKKEVKKRGDSDENAKGETKAHAKSDENKSKPTNKKQKVEEPSLQTKAQKVIGKFLLNRNDVKDAASFDFKLKSKQKRLLKKLQKLSDSIGIASEDDVRKNLKRYGRNPNPSLEERLEVDSNALNKLEVSENGNIHSFIFIYYEIEG